MKQVVAIDGPSGAGKTTIAKLIAKELGFDYLDTGALYRAVALALMDSHIATDDSDKKIRGVLNTTIITFRNGKIFLNGNDVSATIRSKEMDHFSSVFSARKIIRDFLLNTQRTAALNNDLIVEGRDTTTVVFPNAPKKIFLDASVDERAKRRCLQYLEKGINISIEDARQNIIDRDKRDASRDVAPMKVASDALLLDSSSLSIEQVKNKILEFVRTEM